MDTWTHGHTDRDTDMATWPQRHGYTGTGAHGYGHTDNSHRHMGMVIQTWIYDGHTDMYIWTYRHMDVDIQIYEHECGHMDVDVRT